MSNEDEFSDDSEGIKNLRKQFENLNKQNKELQEQLSTFQRRDRNKAVGDILKAKGVSEKAAKFYDGEDTSEDAVDKWLADNGDVFGIKQQESDANSDAVRRMADATYGSDYTVEATGQGAVVGNPEEIQRAIQTLPYDELVKLGYMPKVDGLFSGRR